MNKTLPIIANILAFVIYALGLVSPLTPSEGMPGVRVQITYIGIPLLLLFYSWRSYKSRYAKLAVILAAMSIVFFSVRLLLLQAGSAL